MVLSAPEFAHHIGPQSLTEICLSALKRCLSLANVLPLLELCQHVDFIRDALHAAFVGFLVSTFEVVRTNSHTVSLAEWGPDVQAMLAIRT